MKHCAIKNCTEKPVYRFSPDMDIQGLLACEQHKEQVQLSYMALFLQGDKSLAEQMLDNTEI